MKKEEIKNVDAFALMQAIAMAQEEKREKEEKQKQEVNSKVWKR